MKGKVRASKVRTVQLGDPMWYIIDGVIKVPRAGFQISEGCPSEFRFVIKDCIERGWLKPIAHMTDQEQTWDVLSSDK